MRVLVTGGTGRLGRSLLTTLMDAGHEAVCVDLSRPQGFTGTAHVADLAAPGVALAMMAEIAPDAVVHLAAISVPFSAPEPVILETNSRLAFSVLDAARELGVGRVLAASSPTVLGYGAPGGWSPDFLPLDETHRQQPWNAYALSKQLIENTVAMFARQHTATVFGAFRPCFILSPDEWAGAPTQQGHTIVERLLDPALAAVSLFNYVDARDAADFVLAWLSHATLDDSGEVFFVGAADALALEPLATLLPRFLEVADTAAALTGDTPAFSSARAERQLGWRARRSWRTELSAEHLALLETNPTAPTAPTARTP